MESGEGLGCVARREKGGGRGGFDRANVLLMHSTSLLPRLQTAQAFLDKWDCTITWHYHHQLENSNARVPRLSTGTVCSFAMRGLYEQFLISLTALKGSLAW